MTSLRILSALLFTLAAGLSARAVEPWADSKLPVTDGLELWLDAGRLDAGAKATKEKAIVGSKVAVWLDGSGKGRHLKQPLAKSQPTLARLGDGIAVVRFDGDDDHLRLTGGKDELKAFTVFIVVAPRNNLGGFQIGRASCRDD